MICLSSIEQITKPWREIVDPAGTTISQVKRYTKKRSYIGRYKRNN